MVVRLSNLVLDAHDVEALVSFWAAALGWLAEVDQDADAVLSDPEGNEFCLFAPTLPR